MIKDVVDVDKDLLKGGEWSGVDSCYTVKLMETYYAFEKEWILSKFFSSSMASRYR